MGIRERQVEKFCLRAAQVNCVYSDLHGSVSLLLLSPRNTTDHADHRPSHIRQHPYSPSPQSAADREGLINGTCLYPCAPSVPGALLVCRHKTLLQKKLELLLVGVLS